MESKAVVQEMMVVSAWLVTVKASQVRNRFLIVGPTKLNGLTVGVKREKKESRYLFNEYLLNE